MVFGPKNGIMAPSQPLRFGVLHNGAVALPGAVDLIEKLKRREGLSGGPHHALLL